MKAWRCKPRGYAVVIYWAKNASKARHKALTALNEARADDRYSYKDITVRRAKQYDPPRYTPTELGEMEMHIDARYSFNHKNEEQDETFEELYYKRHPAEKERRDNES